MVKAKAYVLSHTKIIVL